MRHGSASRRMRQRPHGGRRSMSRHPERPRCIPTMHAYIHRRRTGVHMWTTPPGLYLTIHCCTVLLLVYSMLGVGLFGSRARQTGWCARRPRRAFFRLQTARRCRCMHTGTRRVHTCSRADPASHLTRAHHRSPRALEMQIDAAA